VKFQVTDYSNLQQTRLLTDCEFLYHAFVFLSDTRLLANQFKKTNFKIGNRDKSGALL